jgi:quercetin dioxygenase-like cupin family protein
MTAMAMHHASPGEVFDLAPLGSNLKDARTTAIVKSEAFEVVRLVVHAGVEIKTHRVDGPITLHCLEGRARLGLPEATLELSGGQWVYLEGGVPHSIQGIEDTLMLLTIIFPSGDSGRPRER